MDKMDFQVKDTSPITDYLGKWLWNSLSMNETSFDIPELIRFLGELCKCERAYVFEIDIANETFSNTYEWCRAGVTSQKELLQNENLSQIASWVELFNQKKPVVIPDLEAIKLEHPQVYAVLKPQEIHSLISAPIYVQGKLVGFLGIDNPEFLNEGELIPLLYRMGALFSHVIKHRNLEEKVRYNQYHDQLTRSFNKIAMERDFENSKSWKQLGIVSCDLSELKSTNEEFGFAEGDMMVCRCNEFLKNIFGTYEIYRISGDRFVVLCPNIDSAYFDELVLTLEREINSRNYRMVCGYAWSNELPVDPYDVLAGAEHILYKNKAIYFSTPDPKSGKTRNRRFTSVESLVDSFNDNHTGLLYRFIENNYFSFDVFFKSMAIGENYPYFGDLQKDAWFLSDSMKENWGFENNVVHNLLEKWKKFIPYKEDIALYENDIHELLKLKKTVHDLIYRVVDKSGEEFWIRCFGYIKWDEDEQKPLFFCGHVAKLNHAFDADPITNFPREKAAMRDMSTLFYNKKVARCLCFRLNGFGEINEIRGRDTGNNLLKDIARSLLNAFDKKVQFYRLDGLRFLVMISEDCRCKDEEISSKIKTIAADLYGEYNLPIRYPCSVGILGMTLANISPMEIMTDISSVLDIAKNKPETDVVYSVKTLILHREQKHMGLEISKDVANGMANFRVVIQPIVSSKTHRIVGGELLLRWKYLGQNVSPMIFVPILEENNLMPAVGKWVFKQATKLCKRVNAYEPEFFMDFNVSYHQIKDETLLPYMEKVLNEYELSGNRLVMELTETHYNDDPIKLQQFIDSCKKMDMQIALDDFGVGYSSIEMLLKYPANIVKLDRSLMKKMSDSSDTNVFISTIVAACHNFDKLVCVEGVETETELKLVTEAGCDTIQGFYFYKPMEIIDLYTLLVDNKGAFYAGERGRCQ